MGLTQSLTKTPRAKPVVSPSTPLRSAQDRLRRTTIPPFEKGGDRGDFHAQHLV